MIPNLNPLLMTDVYNLSHQMLKENPDWEVSHIVNRQRSMILFGFDAIGHEILDYKIYAKDVEDAALHAKDMTMKFPEELWYKAISVSNNWTVDGKYARPYQDRSSW
jgi:nicotinamide phosphoribosyltransferase